VEKKRLLQIGQKGARSRYCGGVRADSKKKGIDFASKTPGKEKGGRVSIEREGESRNLLGICRGERKKQHGMYSGVTSGGKRKKTRGGEKQTPCSTARKGGKIVLKKKIKIRGCTVGGGTLGILQRRRVMSFLSDDE